MNKLTEDELIATLQAVHIHGSYMAASRAMYYTTRAIQYRIRILQSRHGQPLVVAQHAVLLGAEPRDRLARAVVEPVCPELDRDAA